MKQLFKLTFLTSILLLAACDSGTKKKKTKTPVKSNIVTETVLDYNHPINPPFTQDDPQWCQDSLCYDTLLQQYYVSVIKCNGSSLTGIPPLPAPGIITMNVNLVNIPDSGCLPTDMGYERIDLSVVNTPWQPNNSGVFTLTVERGKKKRKGTKALNSSNHKMGNN